MAFYWFSDLVALWAVAAYAISDTDDGSHGCLDGSGITDLSLVTEAIIGGSQERAIIGVRQGLSRERRSTVNAESN